ncbi:hypothetical protein D3C81_299320 [compost metagenome]|uniref:hypothetical protein n=1 Tax=Pseudomonas putida TaxID=303 RepID=UPI000F974268|nr:hypothetical protein [Pseudomonas putida]
MTANKDKITIRGTPPKYDEAEYDRRLALDLHKYHHTTDSLEHVTASLAHDFLELVADKMKAGYTVARNWRVITDPLNYSCFLKKPDDVQTLDIEAIKANVKASYVEWLQSEHSRYQNLLREQLKQAAVEKEAKAAAEKEARQLAAIEKQVAECYSPLVIPD